MHKLSKFLQMKGGRLNAPASPDDIERTQLRLGFSLPGEMLDFYRSSDGIGEPLHDCCAWDWWCLGRFVKFSDHLNYSKNDDLWLNLGLSAEKTVLFSDVLIGAPFYAVYLGDENDRYGHIIAINPPFYLCESFDAFVDRFVKEDAGTVME